MDAAAIIYIGTILALLVVIVVVVTLFSLARRARKEYVAVGFRAKSKDEKFVGYSLFAAGMAIMIFSVYQILVLFTSGFSAELFGLSNRFMSIIMGVFFWLLLLSFGGRKIATLGLDLLRGRKVKIIRKTPKAETIPS
jgi:hypothetical protein